MWSITVGQNRETNEEHDEDCVEESFSWLRQNLTEMVREIEKLSLWGILVSIFEINQNRRVTRRMVVRAREGGGVGGVVFPVLLQKLEESALIWGKMS